MDVTKACEREGTTMHDPVVTPIGIGFMMLAVMSLLFHYSGVRLSNSVAMVIAGLVIGAAEWHDGPFAISEEIVAALLEIGAMLHMFFEGVSLNFDRFDKYWREVAFLAPVHLVCVTGLFVLIGWSSGLCQDPKSSFFFGLLCAFPSTVLVEEGLNAAGAKDIVYGRIVRGVHSANDIAAVLAFAFIQAFSNSRLADEDASMRRGTTVDAVHAEPTYQQRLFDVPRSEREVAVMIGIFAAVSVVMVVLKMHVLQPMFAFYTRDPELLFIGTVALALGVGAVCDAATFSRMTGVFMAGGAVSFTPYRAEIEHKISSLHTFSLMLFYLMIGILAPLHSADTKAMLPWSALLAGLLVFVCPAITICSGYLWGLTRRTAFYMSFNMNSIGEISLIGQVLAWNASILDDNQFVCLLFATLWSLLVADIVNKHLDTLYNTLARRILPPDAPTKAVAGADPPAMPSNAQDSVPKDQGPDFVDHVVLMGFNEVGLEIADHFRMQGQDVLMIDCDPRLHGTLAAAFHSTESKKTVHDKSFRDFFLSGNKRETLTSATAASRRQSLPRSVLSDPGPMVPPVTQPLAPAAVQARGSVTGSCTLCPPPLMLGEAVPPMMLSGTAFGAEHRSERGPTASDDDDDDDAVVGRRMELTSDDCDDGPGGAVHNGGAELARQMSCKKPADVSQQDASTEVYVSDDEVHSDEEEHNAEKARLASLKKEEIAERRRRLVDARNSSARGSLNHSFSAKPLTHHSSTGGNSRHRRLSSSSRREQTSQAGSGLGHGLTRRKSGTNIFPVFADPQSEETWARYQLKQAALVVWCSIDRAPHDLCRFLKDTAVPFMSISNSNLEASDLYNDHCTYVVQQEYLAAKEFALMLREELAMVDTFGSDEVSTISAHHVGVFHEHKEVDLRVQSKTASESVKKVHATAEEAGLAHTVPNMDREFEKVQELLTTVNKAAEAHAFFRERREDHRTQMRSCDADPIRQRIGAFI